MTRIAGNELSATWSCERVAGGWAVTLESRSGARGTEVARNTHYKEALALILSLLAARAFVLDDVVLSSKTAQTAAPDPATRRVHVPSVEYPLSLKTVDDHAELGRIIQKALAPMFSKRTEAGGGNREKRITLFASASAETPPDLDLRHWIENADLVSTPSRAGRAAFEGKSYREANERVSLNHEGHLEIDPANVERALAGHAKTQNALARFIVARGLTPLSATKLEPDFDIAWIEGDVLNVAEVKSVTDLNEEGQLRLGLGQVLRYRRSLAAQHKGPVRAVLVVERKPLDSEWPALCAELGVVLSWAPFDDLLAASAPSETVA